MITLATLHKATAQEVFDQIALHLITQGKRSERANYCAYKSKGGLKCAAGCLISDDEYNPGLESLNWLDLMVKKMVPNEHGGLILELQNIHDRGSVSNWPVQLKTLASIHNLEVPQEVEDKIDD
jgi:hypothetical protein